MIRLSLPLALLAAALAVGPAQAQPKPPPTNPSAPNIAMFLPLGVQAGQTLDLNLTGTNLAGATGVALTFAGEAQIPKTDKNGQDNAKLKVQLKVPPTAPIGWHEMRLATARGISNPRIICVDTLPQLVEDGKNTTKQTAQALPVPSAVSGTIAAEMGDWYKITVTAGQRLSFDVQGRRLGSPIDPQLSIYNAKTMKEVAFDNDSPGCQGDPRISHVFKEAGDYLVEVRDVLNRGGADYVYRLRVGDFPLATTPLPLAAKRGTKAKVSFAGPFVEGVPPVDVEVPADPTASVVWVTPKSASGVAGWPVALKISDHDEVLEQEPNNEPAKATRVAVPAGVTGRFHQANDTDLYLFSAKKGQKLIIDAQTLELYTPTLVYLVVKNAKSNAEIAKSNPVAAPPAPDQRIDFTAADDGDYLLEVTHLTLAGGPSEVYRVTIVPGAPGFDLNLQNDRAELAAGSIAPILVQVVRRGYTGPIELSASGPAGLTGAATIKPGQNSGVLVVTAKGDQPMGAAFLTVQGKATIDGKAVVVPASARTPLSQSLSGLPHPPMQLNTQVAVAVKEKAPFTLAIKMDPPEGSPGTKTNVTITAKRDAGFTEEIVISPPLNLPPAVAAPKIPNIAKDKSEVKFTLDLNPKTPLGEFPVLFTAKAKLKDKEVSTAAPPLNVVLAPPFELKIEPAALNLNPGAKAKVKVTATRRAGYKGPIAVELRKLPATITGGKGTIAADQNMVEIELTAAANAPPAETPGIDALGTATALNNLTNASPAITVRIQKK